MKVDVGKVAWEDEKEEFSYEDNKHIKKCKAIKIRFTINV